MRHFVYQGNEQDCGFAALKMLLCRVQRNSSFLQLSKGEGKRRSYSYRDLLTIAADNGVTLKAYRLINKEEIRTWRPLPILAVINNKEHRLHMVLIHKIRHGQVFIDDPQYGSIRKSCSEFIKTWDGTFLSVSDVKMVKPVKRDSHILSPTSHVALIIMQALSAIFALVGFAFISAESYFIFPLLFFAISIVSELLFRRYQFIVLARFDKRYLSLTYHDDKTLMRGKFARYHEFKRRYFLYPQTIVQSSVIVLSSFIVLIFNDLSHIIYLMMLLLCVILERVWRVTIYNRKRQRIENMEQDIFRSGLTKEAVEEHLKNMSRDSLSLAKGVASRKYVGLFLVAVAALIYTAISGEVSLNYFIFHFMFYMLFHDNLALLSSCLEDIKEIKRRSAEFRDEFV